MAYLRSQNLTRPGAPPVSRAIALGAVQGPAELLPVSSSAHIELVPWFAGWGWDELPAATRKDFEVALHAGTAAALLVGQRRAIAHELRRLNARRAAAIAVATAIPALAGFAFERPIEERLGGPPAIAAGLVAGAAAMLLADRRPQDRHPDELNAVDGLVLGAAQAAALYPGVSRTGATVAAARLRRFSRGEASLLSRTVALPIIAGAVGLRVRRRGRLRFDRGVGFGMAAGALAAAASTLASQRLIAARESAPSVRPFAAYRAVLAAAIVVKLRRDG
jgi:undecaprenyl-diphosphatase